MSPYRRKGGCPCRILISGPAWVLLSPERYQGFVNDIMELAEGNAKNMSTFRKEKKTKISIVSTYRKTN